MSPTSEAVELAQMIVRAFEQGPVAGDRVVTFRYNGYLHCAARRIIKTAAKVAAERNMK